MHFSIKEGDYEKMGAVVTQEGTIFTFEGEKEADCAILLYRRNTTEAVRIEVPRAYCIGALRSVLVKKIDIRRYQYNYEIDGKEQVDPYAQRIEGRERWYETKRYQPGYQVRGGFIQSAYDWEDDHTPEILPEDMVMYKLHVRGYTMDGGAAGRKRGTFAALKEKIPYLRKLGITTVELMPAYEFEELVLPMEPCAPDYLSYRKQEDEPKEEQTVKKVNFWGYVPGNYFAPKASYAYGREADVEFKDLIKELHRNSMECIMEIYFDSTVSQRMMAEVLRFWVKQYHVDGFHLAGGQLAVEEAAQDVLLRRTKLFCTGYGTALLEKKTAYPHLYIYNDEYLYPLRKLLNHMEGSMYEFANQQKKQGLYHGYVNYAAINNSFTLADVFMYSEKHNLENGENNADGSDWNYSSNYGIEGPTRKKYVAQQRKRQMKNALAMVMLAQGVPLIASGDEFGNSQKGNNNAYCQDNKTGWVNWNEAKKNASFTQYVEQLIRFRREHPIIRASQPMRMNDYKGEGYPDLSYHADSAWVNGFDASRRSAGMLYCSAYATQPPDGDAFVYAAYNFHHGKCHLALPKLPKGVKWYAVMNTALDEPFYKEEICLTQQELLEMDGSSVRLLVGRRN